MKRTLFLMALVLASLAVAGGVVRAQRGGAAAPALQVNPLWPEPLPNHWVLGSVTGVAVDARDHVWVTHRGADSLEGGEKGMMLTPPTSSLCCTAAPFVLQFDAEGKLVSNFGGPGQGYQWPQSPGSLVVDAKNNVWIAAAGLEPAPAGSGRGRGGVDTTAAGVAAAARGTAAPAPTGPPDAHVLKFSSDGKFLLQIGTPGKIEGPDSQTTLNRPAAVAVDTAANEVYVADSGNHRVVVFNSETGAYKRHWGAYGEKPTAEGGGTYDPAAPPARQFRDVTCVEIAKDGMVYVCDRTSNRIQVFQKDGKFVKEGIISKNTRGATVTGQFGVVSSHGAVWDIAFSSDAAQQHIFVADGHDKKVLIVQRDTLTEVGSLGDGGRQPGRFLAVGSIATDSRGNLYTGEQHHGKRVQKFVAAARR
jgi:DNA-binding beta-propeller fold protein YncE